MDIMAQRDGQRVLMTKNREILNILQNGMETLRKNEKKEI